MKHFDHVLAGAAVAFLLGGSPSASAQDEEQIIQCEKVPAAVRSAFANTYPKATIKGCAKEVENGKTAYEIASVERGIGRDVLYDAKGMLIVVEETIATAALPKAVQQAAHTKAPKGKIILAEKLTRGSSVTYELQINSQGKTMEIIFDANGSEIPP
jgi:uncharacterized membrane protein YkoI